MSCTQFHSIKLFILRHAWLNLCSGHPNQQGEYTPRGKDEDRYTQKRSEELTKA